MAIFALSAFADEAGSSLSQQIKALKDNSIKYIEPRNIDGKGILDLTDEELNEVKNQLDKNGIKVNSLGSPIGKYPIEDDFESYIPKIKRSFQVAKLLGTNLIRMFSFFVSQDALDKWESEVFRRLNVMTSMAKEEGILLCHENESKIFGQEPKEVARLLSGIPDLHGIFDPANYRMNGADPLVGLDATLINLKYVHIKDAIYSEQCIVRAGYGEGRIAEAINLINKKYDGVVYLTLEPHLHLFDAYKSIDEHELKGCEVYNSQRDAFDAAAKALKELLRSQGYKEESEGIWIK